MSIRLGKKKHRRKDDALVGADSGAKSLESSDSSRGSSVASSSSAGSANIITNPLWRYQNLVTKTQQAKRPWNASPAKVREPPIGGKSMLDLRAAESRRTQLQRASSVSVAFSSTAAATDAATSPSVSPRNTPSPRFAPSALERSPRSPTAAGALNSSSPRSKSPGPSARRTLSPRGPRSLTISGPSRSAHSSGTRSRSRSHSSGNGSADRDSLPHSPLAASTPVPGPERAQPRANSTTNPLSTSAPSAEQQTLTQSGASPVTALVAAGITFTFEDDDDDDDDDDEADDADDDEGYSSCSDLSSSQDHSPLPSPRIPSIVLPARVATCETQGQVQPSPRGPHSNPSSPRVPYLPPVPSSPLARVAATASARSNNLVPSLSLNAEQTQFFDDIRRVDSPRLSARPTAPSTPHLQRRKTASKPKTLTRVRSEPFLKSWHYQIRTTSVTVPSALDVQASVSTGLRFSPGVGFSDDTNEIAASPSGGYAKLARSLSSKTVSSVSKRSSALGSLTAAPLPESMSFTSLLKDFRLFSTQYAKEEAPKVVKQVVEDENIEPTFTVVENKRYLSTSTVRQAIRALTDPNELQDMDTVHVFLLTHPYFCSSTGVLDMLDERYTEPPPEQLDDAARDHFGPMVQLRVINILKKWLENANFGLRRNASTVEYLKKVLRKWEALGGKGEMWATRLKESLDEYDDRNTVFDEQMEADETLTPLLPIDVHNPESLTFIDLHPLEIARQLTLIDHEMYRAITAPELFRCAWNKKDKMNRAPSVIEMTERFNRLSFWVASEIVSTKNSALRLEVLLRFIKLAEYFVQLNNFHSSMILYAALNMTPVQRLKSTWKEVPSKRRRPLDELAELFNPTGNYKNYRARVQQVDGPMVPFLAVMLSDLTTAEEIPDRSENGHVNFEKMMLIGRVLQSVEQQQLNRYRFVAVKYIQDRFKDPFVLSEKDLYENSKQCESHFQPQASSLSLSRIVELEEVAASSFNRREKLKKRQLKQEKKERELRERAQRKEKKIQKRRMRTLQKDDRKKAADKKKADKRKGSRGEDGEDLDEEERRRAEELRPDEEFAAGPQFVFRGRSNTLA
eukprot:CAMPEP_0174230756 /NCGR_PEP_ID=MMETSP0417-20130205/1444_1 /TAXON_ID=242541 /ORGANISM="Mayorella sp, Strain BSH-02190019" /LENGTH=1080 /DNA_ID=CAMNT_0015308515 /DNA_START=106 /DNA_END=3348 /DNA_ORIENTATION=+